MFLTKLDRPNLYPMGASLEKVFDEFLENSFKEMGNNKYPMTDIYTENGVTHIEVAVTGFSDKDIEISLENDLLTIKASHEDKSEEDSKIYHIKNIATRSFIRKFTVSNTVEDIKAEIENGVLHLELIEKEKEEIKKVIQIENKK
jgi:HSP20 family molecular chaperone IbpA